MVLKYIGKLTCSNCTYVHKLHTGHNTLTKEQFNKALQEETNRIFTLSKTIKGEKTYGLKCTQCNNYNIFKVNKSIFGKYNIYGVKKLDTSKWTDEEWLNTKKRISSL